MNFVDYVRTQGGEPFQQTIASAIDNMYIDGGLLTVNIPPKHGATQLGLVWLTRWIQERMNPLTKIGYITFGTERAMFSVQAAALDVRPQDSLRISEEGWPVSQELPHVIVGDVTCPYTSNPETRRQVADGLARWTPLWARSGSLVVILEPRTGKYDLTGLLMMKNSNSQAHNICLPYKYEPRHPRVSDYDLRSVRGERLAGSWSDARDNNSDLDYQSWTYQQMSRDEELIVNGISA